MHLEFVIVITVTVNLNHKTMTNKELNYWKTNFKEEVWKGLTPKLNYRGKRTIVINGVSFWEDSSIGTIDFSYKKMYGFLTPDNGYYGGDSYYPIIKGILCRNMGGTVSGGKNLKEFSEEVKEYWENFIK